MGSSKYKLIAEKIGMWQFERDEELRAAAGDVDRSALKIATPSWADHAAIEAFYVEARRLTAETGILHEVDHIVPIPGKRVCGLHVEANPQILTKIDNVKKHSRFRGIGKDYGFCSDDP